MELNRKVIRDSGKVVVNPEGGKSFAEKDDKSLFLNASAFKLRNSFYWSAKDNLSVLEALIDDNTDLTYKLALAKFLSTMLGIRLSPVIITTREAMKLKGYKGSPLSRALLKSVVKDVYDRPDKIANALAYAQYQSNEFRSLPPFYKKALRDALERFDEYSLRKFKLKRRMVKMADIIKALRPRPRNEGLSKLYADIIGNSSGAAIEKDTVVTAVLSDTSKTNEEKREWVDENLEKIPFNALIRNLGNVANNEKNAEILAGRLNRALRVENGVPVVKIANPFDVLTAGVNSKYSQFMRVIDGALTDYLSQVNLLDNGANVSILVDVSGSMARTGIEIVGDYLALLLPTLTNTNIKLYEFGVSVRDVSKRLPLYLNNGPITIRSLISRDFKPSGGTALAESVRKVAKSDTPDLMIVMSDEVSWADTDGSNQVFDIGCPVIAINPLPQGRFTAFAPNLPVIKLSSLDARIFYFIPALSNFNGFKAWLKKWAFGDLDLKFSS